MVAYLSSTMTTFSIILAVFLLLGKGSASIPDHCNDISYWDEIRYETTTKQCCDTKLHQVCTTKRDQICEDVLELQCEVVAWGECQSTPTSTPSTKCIVKYNDFAHQNCEEVTTSVLHTKKVPECKEITKNNCVTDWDLDSNGNKVWAGTETCTPVTWEECYIVEKTVEFPTVKTECDVDSNIKWAEFVDITTNIVGLESKCEVKKAVNCKHVVANKCAPVVWQECKMEPREACLAKVIHTPFQEKIHQKKCLTGDNTAHLNQIRPRNQLQQKDRSPSDPAPLKPTRGQASPATKMRNIGTVFSGYDIMKGNPLPVEPFPVDPGFRQPIFNASYQSGSMTADRRYLQPDGTSIRRCEACSLSFGTTEVSGSKSYQESLARKVRLSGGGSSGMWGGKFSASYAYKEVAEKTSSASNLFTLSSASCCAYSVELLSFKGPSLSQNFISGVETLTEKYDETIYFGFINAFGTHFIGLARMGALYGQQSEISKEAWTNMQETGIDIGTGAELSAYAITASADFSNSEKGKKAKAFSSKTEDQKTFTIGVKPPADGKRGTWLQKIISEPAPIELTLGGSILDLFYHDDIKSKVSTAVKANMKKALDDYCGFLFKSGEAKTCSSPVADPAFPSAIDNLAGSCEVHVGKSTSNTISAIVSEGCVCPTLVNRRNWLSDDNTPDEFKVTQDGSSLQVRRIDSNTGWTTGLSFKCFRGSCEVHIGRSTSNTISVTVSEGCECPTLVNKGNWLDDGTYPDEFKVTQDGSSLQVQRIDSNSGWSVDLSFKCFRGYRETSVINLDALTFWGKWGKVEKCSYPHFVNKMDLKYEERYLHDDTALNAIRLTCTDGHTISSTEGPFGYWETAIDTNPWDLYNPFHSPLQLTTSNSESCPQGKYINAARIRSEAKTDGDNTAANGIRFKCTDGSEEYEPKDGDWGSWRPWKSCEDGSAIYGIQTLVQPSIDGDDTALNNVKFFCAKLPNRG